MFFKREKKEIIREMIVISLIAISVDLVIYFAILPYIFLYKPEGSLFNVLCTLFGVFVMGVFLFYLRRHHQRFYGLLELTFAGLNVLAYLLATSTNDEKAFAMLFSHLATLYVIVRGLDNCFPLKKETNKV